MSSAPNGPDGTAGVGTAQGPAQGAGSAAPQGAQQGSQQSGGQGNFIQADRQAFEPWGGDYHKPIELAKKHQEYEERIGNKYNMTVEQLLDFLDQSAAEGQASGDGQPAGEPSEEARAGAAATGLTPEAIQKIMDERLEAHDQKREKKEAERAQQTARQAAMQRAQDVRQKAANDALSAVGVKPNDKGDLPKSADILQIVHSLLVDRVMEDELPSWQKKDGSNLWSHLELTAPTAKQTAKATQLLSDFIADIKAEGIASFAQGQENQPGQTLGAGASGRTPPVTGKDFEKMSNQEQLLFLAGKM